MSDGPIDKLEPELDTLLDHERRATVDPAAIDRLWTRVSADVAVPAAASSAGGALASAGRMVAVAAMASFVVGAIVGAAVHALVQEPPGERVVYVDRPPRTSRSADVVSSPAQIPSAAPSASNTPRSNTSPAPSTLSSAETLAAERTLLDASRSALTLTDDHARRFPHGQLQEEREAIAIQVLVTLGRYDDARARAARFRARTPHSLFLPAVDASLASIP